MHEQFLNHIRQRTLCSADQKILLAVSGGLDSMVMTHLFRAAGFSIGVAHANFQLRGEASTGDEQFVKEFCAQLQIPFYTKKFETESFATQNGLSIQMAARELRYAWFDELLEQYHFEWVATAHHVNDSIETVLLNWTRGASLEGFSGIPVKNRRTIRPMLFATRSDIEEYARGHKINWREDESNATDDYERNFIRHQVIPKLKEINPALESTIQRGFEKIADELSFLSAQLEEWKQKHVTNTGKNITIEKKYVLNAGMLWRIIRELGFNFDQCENIVTALNAQPGKRFLSPTHELVIDRQEIVITEHQDFWKDILIQEMQAMASLGPWNMEIEKSASLEVSSESMTAVLDAEKITFPLLWRTWKSGDFFYPLGMEHKRKVSDFLIDKKVSVAEKKTVTVLESNGEILWVVGYRIDNRFKLTDRTRSVLKLSIHPHFV
jgi:tRNA(Ile)-lysidine synthase